jgi:hypothetical protein
MNAFLIVDATKANDPAMRELFLLAQEEILICQLHSHYMPVLVVAESTPGPWCGTSSCGMANTTTIEPRRDQYRSELSVLHCAC